MSELSQQRTRARTYVSMSSRRERIDAMVRELEAGADRARAHERRMREFLDEATHDGWLPENVAIARESVAAAERDVQHADARLAEARRIVAALGQKHEASHD